MIFLYIVINWKILLKKPMKKSQFNKIKMIKCKKKISKKEIKY